MNLIHIGNVSAHRKKDGTFLLIEGPLTHIFLSGEIWGRNLPTNSPEVVQALKSATNLNWGFASVVESQKGVVLNNTVANFRAEEGWNSENIIESYQEPQGALAPIADLLVSGTIGGVPYTQTILLFKSQAIANGFVHMHAKRPGTH